MSTKGFRLGLVSILALACTGAAATSPPKADLLIRGGTIYTGDAAPFVGDLLITGDRISYVGPATKQAAQRVIDARGLIVSPGFIDPHAHVELALNSTDAVARLGLPFLTQGVTTAVLGADGTGVLDTGRQLASPKKAPVGINFATYVGLEPVRTKVMGPSGQESSPAQLDEMRALVAKSMCEGAIGLSTGLYYPPQAFATQQELIELSKEAARRGGIYDSHIRDESNNKGGWPAAIQEAIAIGRGADIPIHIAHLKAAGRDVNGKAGEIIAMIEAGRASGVKLTADQYPWDAGATTLSPIVLPAYAIDGGDAAFRARMKDPVMAEKIKAEMRDRLAKAGGAKSIMLYTEDGKYWAKRLDLLIEERGKDPIETILDLLYEQEIAVVITNMIEPDIRQIMRQPWVMTGSDAAIPHPRYYGSFSRKYARYVRDNKVISVRDFIDRSTSLTADTLHIKDRGRLAVGKYADVVLFDPERFAERATYETPDRFSVGIKAVLVNGKLAIEDGAPTGIAAGRGLGGQAPAGTCPAN